ncbi:hypothetical protein QQF64_034631 [Cirrhinus molitorella]|uniref:AIG1-type G domain-containing protein n=1 Tax=Cirrhinus molitorella TaxID=172907 RepID=A0ABR3L0U9_9TELE
MAYSRHTAGRQSPDSERPNMRIVLLGKSVSENSRVGNFILGRAAFDSEAPPDVVERVGGRLKNRHVMLINSPQVLQPQLAFNQITQTVRECVNLSDPGPHAFIIILQYNDFTEEDMTRVNYVLKEFSEEAIKRTIVITTDEETDRAKVKFITRLTAGCGGGHLQLDHEIQRQFTGISQRLEKILRENDEEFLTCDIFDDAEETLVDEDQSRSEMQEEDSGDDSDKMAKIQCHSQLTSLSNTEQGPEYDHLKGSINVTRKLTMVVCGFNETLKKSISKRLIEKRKFFISLHQKEKGKYCVKKEGKIHGRKITLVKLPALSRLSEEEVMNQTNQCVSLCHPGIHVFLLIIPAGSLTDEDKAEIQEIKRRFSSRINKHIMFIKIQDKNMPSPVNLVPSAATETFIQTFGNQQFVLENNSQVPALLQEVENVVKINNGRCYVNFMYLQACVELERSKHRAEIEELRRSMKKKTGCSGGLAIWSTGTLPAWAQTSPPYLVYSKTAGPGPRPFFSSDFRTDIRCVAIA